MALCVENDEYDPFYDFFSEDFKDKGCGKIGLADAEIVQLFFMFLTVYVVIDGLGWPQYQQQMLLEKSKDEFMTNLPVFERKGTVSKLFGFVRFDRFLNNCILNMNSFLSTLAILLLVFDTRMGFPAIWDRDNFKLTLSVQYASRLIPHLLIVIFNIVQYRAEKRVLWTYELKNTLYTIERYMDKACAYFAYVVLALPLCILSIPVFPTILVSIGCYAASFFATMVVLIAFHAAFVCVAGIPMSYMQKPMDNLKIEIVVSNIINNVHYLFLILMLPIPLGVLLADLAGEFMSNYNCGTTESYCIFPSNDGYSFDVIAALQFVLTILLQTMAYALYYLGEYSIRIQTYVPVATSYYFITQTDGLLRAMNEQDYVMRAQLKSQGFESEANRGGVIQLTSTMISEGISSQSADDFQRFMRSHSEETYDRWATLRFQYDSVREARQLMREGIPLMRKTPI